MSINGHKIVSLAFQSQCQGLKVSELKLWMKKEMLVFGVAGGRHLTSAVLAPRGARSSRSAVGASSPRGLRAAALRVRCKKNYQLCCVQPL